MFCLTLLTFAVKKKKKTNVDQNQSWEKSAYFIFHSQAAIHYWAKSIKSVPYLVTLKKKSQFWPSYDFDLNFPISQKVTDEGETDDFISATWIEYHSSPSYTSRQLAHFQNIKTRIKYPQINILPIVYVN